MGLSVLDDRDPSIDYSIGWNKAGSSLEFNRTTTWSIVAGTTAKVTFRGTGIGVYGTISAKQRRSVPPVSGYSIDGGSEVQFTPTQAAKPQYSQLFFQSPSMSDGTHILTITNKLAATDPFFLDFLFVLDADPDSTVTGGLPTLSSAIPGSSTSSSTTASSTSVSSSSSSSSSSSVSSTSTTASSTTSEFQTNTITVTSTPPPPSASTIADSANNNAGDVGAAKKSNAGAIVGGVIAGIVVLAFLVFGLFYWNRKRQRRHSFLDYKAAGSQSYWNRPLEAAATPSSAPPPQTTEPFTPTPPRAPMMTRNDTASSLSVSTYGQPQTAYTQGYSQAQTPGYGSQGYTPAPAGYMPPTPGPDYYESSDLAYAVNPGPPSAGSGYGYGQGIGQGAGYGQGYTDSRESDIYAAPQVQPAQGYGGTGGYIPPSQLLQQNAGNSSGYYSAQNQPGQRARTRLD